MEPRSFDRGDGATFFRVVNMTTGFNGAAVF